MSLWLHPFYLANLLTAYRPMNKQTNKHHAAESFIDSKDFLS